MREWLDPHALWVGVEGGPSAPTLGGATPDVWFAWGIAQPEKAFRKPEGVKNKGHMNLPKRQQSSPRTPGHQFLIWWTFCLLVDTMIIICFFAAS